MSKKKQAQAQPVITENSSLQVFSYNHEGYFVGTDFAFPDPLTPGEFLIPAYAVTVAPPAFKQDEIARWNGSEWEIEAIEQPAPELEPTEQELAANARAQRNALLAQSDWTQIADAPLTAKQREEWTAYRAKLREVTKQKGFPTTINWPTAP